MGWKTGLGIAVVVAGVIGTGWYQLDGRTNIETGNFGIIKHLDGKVTQVPQGYQWTGIGVSVDQLPYALQVLNYNTTLSTHDNQELPVGVMLKYTLNTNDLTTLYQTVGGKGIDYINNNLVLNDLEAIFTDVAHKYDYMDLKSGKLSDISGQIQDQLTQQLAQDGIIVEHFGFTHLGVPAGMQGVTAELAQAEAKQQVAQANQQTAITLNQTMILNAQAKAKADMIQAQANSKIAQSYSPLMIQMEYAKAAQELAKNLQGMPNTLILGNGSTPFNILPATGASK